VLKSEEADSCFQGKILFHTIKLGSIMTSYDMVYRPDRHVSHIFDPQLWIEPYPEFLLFGMLLKPLFWRSSHPAELVKHHSRRASEFITAG
jgi:hypothetical protein